MRRECPHCNKIFEGRGSTKYCSHKCGKEYKRYRPGKMETQCKTCGKSIIGNARKSFCSNHCNQKYLKANPKPKKETPVKKEPNSVIFDWDDYSEGII